MDTSSCFQLGYVVKTHGLKGDVTIFLDVDYPEDYQKLESVLVEQNGQLIPFFITSIKVRDSKAIVKFESVDSIEDAEQLKSARLYLPLDSLPQLEDDQFYFHEIIGFDIKDEQLGVIGKVQEVFDMPNQALIQMIYKGREVLIPIRDEVTLKVNREEETLYVNLPEGLLDVYLND